MAEHGLGRLTAPDTRDAQHPMAALLGAEPVPDRLWRYWTPGAVLDQGQEPHCVGYAWRQWLSASPTRTRDGPAAPAIYSAAQLVDEWPGEGYAGTSVRAGAKVLQAEGRVGEYVWAETWQQVRDWILTRGPVVLGTDWYEDMFEPDGSGRVYPTGGFVGGHAYIAIGYRTEGQGPSDGAFRCLNSWGSAWGQRGRFWIDAEAFAFLLGNEGEACAAIELTPGGG